MLLTLKIKEKLPIELIVILMFIEEKRLKLFMEYFLNK